MIMTMQKFFIILIALLILVSCATKEKKEAGKPGDLYVEGVRLTKEKKYGKAIEKFNELRENYPFDPLASLAMLKLGDTYFTQKQYLLASGVYEEFLKAHPDDENIPYILSRLGECYEKLSLTIDRDQANTVKAIERYTFLKNRFPTSIYAKDADTRIARMNQKLADRELYVGEFYYRTFQYNAAIRRFEYFLKTYPNAKGADMALFYLGQSHREMGNFVTSDEYGARLRKDYPKSIYARSTTRERKSLQLVKTTGSPFRYDEKTKRDIELRPQQQVVKAEPRKDKKDDLMFDESKPVDIISDSMQGFEKGKYVVFKGSVVARQDDLYIFSDMMEAFTSETTSEIEKANAKGNVKIVRRERTATANEASFDNKTRVITLKGNVIVYSGTDRVTGELVTYYVNEDRVVVEGEKDKKARVIITPK